MVHSRSSRSGSSELASLVSGLARKFWTMTSWIWPCSACRSQIASSASIRSSRVSPMPIRIPVSERNLQFAGQTQGLQPDRRKFVGRTVVNAALPAEPLAGRLQHDALTGRHLPQAGDLLARHHAGIGMRQQSGLAQHKRAHRSQIGNRGFVAERLQCVARGLVSQLRLVAQREQRFGATCGRAGARDGEHLVG